ncbi:Glyoxylase, beta-lactamase superfamily II [Chitinophaga costaii]|uniref:Glyoxylase, beta-lactamase superfamily II n=1 Tax=Chitinophaga costaii TaxID=1335309 RepID=A0A1C4DVR0_9BACT|nr:MBL fold metallo-hydrolase [Chitinophaga costaii]PUZ27825.1 MBL fold metallo-hydrolase [Chitinophaga costaii]SCC35443.1 Glyoxylase, beta-lactamase superfamily II [Chitinophaga costaii]
MIQIQQFTFNPFSENTYLLINDQKECIVIDPGCYYEEERKALLDFIAHEKLHVIQLLNTHTHFDHIFGNSLIAKTFGLKPVFHAADQPVFDKASEMGVMYNTPFEPSVPPARYLEAGEHIPFGDVELAVLLTPGHSPGSVVFYCAQEKFAIGGDVLFYRSIGRTDLPYGDHETLLDSIRQQLFTLPEEVKVYPGHGQPTTIGFEKKHNPFLQE